MSLPSSSGSSFPLAQRREFDLQTRLYAEKPLPDLPLQPKKHNHFKRKPVASHARLVGETARLPMARQKQDLAQDQELHTPPTQGRSLSSNCVPVLWPLSPPPKSPFRRRPDSTPTPTSPKRASHQRKSSAKVHQLTGLDVDVFDDSPWKYGHFQIDVASDSSSVYSQGSTNNTSTMKSWHTATDIPPLENEQDGESSRAESWEPRSPPVSTSPLERRQRTDRKSPDRHMLDNYHRIVTDIASPTSSHNSDLLTAIAPRDDGMPADFDVMLNDPRRPPHPPPKPVGPDGERLGSYFDFNSDSDDGQDESEGIFSTSARGRDSFLGMLLGRGGGEAGSHPHRPASVSTGAGRPSSELDIGVSESAEAEAGKYRKGSGSKRAALKGLVDWAKKDGAEEEAERRRQELRQKITVHGGRRI